MHRIGSVATIIVAIESDLVVTAFIRLIRPWAAESICASCSLIMFEFRICWSLVWIGMSPVSLI
ncbi:hypothetical protein D3C76_1833320 [compost metagenome]